MRCSTLPKIQALLGPCRPHEFYMVPAWAGEHIVRRTVRGSPAKLLRLESGQAPDGCTGRTRHTGRCRALPSPSLQCRRWPRPITPPLHGTLGRLACPSVSFPRSPSRFASECVPGCNVDPSAGGPGDHWARCRSSRTRFLSQHCAIRSKLRSVIWSDSCSSRVSLPPATPPHTSDSQSSYPNLPATRFSLSVSVFRAY